ncbi:ubiquitin conjugating enzyme E2 [Aspergillus sclerotiicarbonarius CBS 121057]|uniref:Ubiquitin conjugating enzyme E2 n=1 Tax=Aspergillus sclerotiicarbonarius (strain CBS 121057 / IBT 28362) TaxID=1448318 RepID=A0A319EQ41_ASPSB|nr:ubiquitin conjugating enzyme E2 [Aspergillus sclerotiicarbonarius CBS 121057]
MVSSLRRLAADHAALHEELPPNYLFPCEDASTGDDLTQLTTLLAGPQGTPYSQGLWRLHLKMPEDYPKSPPKATFRTRIWHPNVEESTGAVCVDTLKRDWKPTLTLKDVLITISCLLIYPNPDSALNSAAGALLQENYDAFARQAKLMTSIHAPVPSELASVVSEAKTRGEDAGAVIPAEQEESRSLRTRKGIRIASVTMKKRITRNGGEESSSSRAFSHQPSTPIEYQEQQPEELDDTLDTTISDDESETSTNASKENDPSLSPSPVRLALPNIRKNAFGKRPLSVLTMPMDMDDPFAMDTEDMTVDGMSASEKNIAANYPSDIPDRGHSPQRKSPKLSVLDKGINSSGRIREDVQIFEDDPDPAELGFVRRASGDGKENPRALNGLKDSDPAITISHPSNPPTILAPSASTPVPSGSRLSKPVMGSRKVSASNGKKAKPRIGIRRL